MHIIYNLIYTLAILILFIPQYLRRPAELRRKWLRERLGLFDALRCPSNELTFWVHAVSVGEVNASIPLIKRLKDGYPSCNIILSTITDTGQKIAKERAPEGTSVIYMPFDIGFILRRCIRRIRPKMLIIMETELWPNLIRNFDKNKIPVILLNGRISEKSFKGYKKISFFMKKIFSHVRIFCMQSHEAAERIVDIGADRNKVIVSGNFKFDMNSPGAIPDWAKRLKRPVIVAGSTHRGEEEIMISVFQENVKRFPGLKFIIAPRHPERFDEVWELLISKHIPSIKRSQIDAYKLDLLQNKATVILLDTVGELSSIYGIADIAIIGKSFVGSGGQNPLEPAYWGKTIVCGPNMENFPFIKDFIKNEAAFSVNTNELSKKISELLSAPEKMAATGAKARELFIRNSGAVERAMKIIHEYVR